MTGPRLPDRSFGIAITLAVVAAAAFVVFLWAAEACAQVQDVNRPGRQETACACALGGAHGACLPDALARELRSEAKIQLPACEAKLAARSEECEKSRGRAEKAEGAVGACEVARAAETASKEDLRGLLRNLGALPKIETPPSRAKWFGIGLAAGVAVVVGIVVALPPLLRSVHGGTSSAANALTIAAPAIVRWW